MGAARWGVLAACLAAAVAVLALVAGAIGGQQRPAPALPAASGPAARRLLDGPWIVRGDHAGRGVRAGLARGPLRRAHGDDALLAQRAPRARRGRRALVRRLGRLVPHDGHRAARGRLRDPLRVGQPPRRRSGSTGASSRATPAPTCPSRPARAWPPAPHELVVRADWRDPAAMKADAWHRTWFNFGGINGPVSIRALGAERARRRRRSSPGCSGNDAVVDVAVGVTNRAGPRTHRGARDAGRRPRCASRRCTLDRGAARHRPRPGAHRSARTCGSPATRRSRRCASRSPARRVFTAARRPARAALGRRAAAAQRRAAEAARRLAAGGRAGPRRRAHRRRRRTRSSRG